MGIAINTEMERDLNQGQIPEDKAPTASSLTANQEPEHPCSQELKNKLAHDGKEVFKITYQDKNGQLFVVTTVAVSKTEALEKFKTAFTRPLVTCQDNCFNGKPPEKKLARWDRSTEPSVFSKKEFAFHYPAPAKI